MNREEAINALKAGPEGVEKWNRYREGAGELPDLTKVNLNDCRLEGANLSGLDLHGSALIRTSLRKANLRAAILHHASLVSAHLEGADLSEVNLRSVNLGDVNLGNANLSNANLEEVNLSRINLRGANLVGAHLRGVDFSGADLRDADLTGDNLQFVNFNGAMLSGTNFARTDCAATVFSNVDLSQANGLEEIRHWGPSTVGVDTLYKSGGRIPVVFLRGTGVPDALIQYVGSLTAAALEFYTCFISFTSADDTFSQRLYNDLQAAGVRCWRWKEDAKWGRTLMGEVDTAIRVYDKLVVILSEASLKAEPVIREIERALQKEQREGKEVLFPIRLDEAVFSWNHALQADVVRKVIGDFREWHEPTKYDGALKRLIAGLRAEARPT